MPCHLCYMNNIHISQLAFSGDTCTYGWVNASEKQTNQENIKLFFFNQWCRNISGCKVRCATQYALSLYSVSSYIHIKYKLVLSVFWVGTLWVVVLTSVNATFCLFVFFHSTVGLWHTKYSVILLIIKAIFILFYYEHILKLYICIICTTLYFILLLLFFFYYFCVCTWHHVKFLVL